MNGIDGRIVVVPGDEQRIGLHDEDRAPDPGGQMGVGRAA
jgi:hypothetical protein